MGAARWKRRRRSLSTLSLSRITSSSGSATRCQSSFGCSICWTKSRIVPRLVSCDDWAGHCAVQAAHQYCVCHRIHLSGFAVDSDRRGRQVEPVQVAAEVAVPVQHLSKVVL